MAGTGLGPPRIRHLLKVPFAGRHYPESKKQRSWRRDEPSSLNDSGGVRGTEHRGHVPALLDLTIHPIEETGQAHNKRKKAVLESQPF